MFFQGQLCIMLFHVTSHQEWFSTYADGKTRCMHLGNGYACDIEGVGDVRFAFANGSSYVLQNVQHIPKLTKSLISVGQLDYHTSFNNQHWKI